MSTADTSTLEDRTQELINNTVFSEQEARVFALREHGYSRTEIADELDLSRSTVNEYMRRISQRQQKVRGTLSLLENSKNQSTTNDNSPEQSLPGFDIDADGHRQLFLCPAANDKAKQHLRSTVLDGVDVSDYRVLIPNQFDDTVAIWGTGTSAGTKVRRGDVVAFYVGDRTYSHIAVVQHTETNEGLDQALWTTYEGTLKQDETDSWPHVFYLSEPIEVDLASPTLHGDLDYDDEFPLGFRRVANHRVVDLYSKHGSLEQYFLRAREGAAASPMGSSDGRSSADMRRDSSIGPSDRTTTADTDEGDGNGNLTGSPDLDVLREQAQQASQKTTTTTTTTTTQQQRSDKVRRYALARADGMCEGCETDAPFVTQGGNPYLEVHHVFRLSDDGADNIQSVVAICPTCHRRIHHAHDGNEYNNELIEKLRTDIEPE